LGTVGPRPLAAGASLTPLKCTPPPHVLSCQIWSFSVKRYECHKGNPPENFYPRVPPFRVIQGHRHRHVSIRHLTSYLRFIATMSISSTFSEINGDFSQKLLIFPPRVFCVSAEGVPAP